VESYKIASISGPYVACTIIGKEGTYCRRREKRAAFCSDRREVEQFIRTAPVYVKSYPRSIGQSVTYPSPSSHC